jgi:hypothetical protein
MPMADIDKRYHIEEWARRIDQLEVDGAREIAGLMSVAPGALKEDSGIGAFFDGYTKRIQAAREEMRIREDALTEMLRFAGALKAYVQARKDD